MAQKKIPVYQKYDYEKEYQQAIDQMRAAEDAAYEQGKSALDYQAGQLGGQYDKIRGDIYKNARVSAIGNNEVLAAKGLAGGLYDTAKSGVSESARISQDNAMRNALNAASTQEQKQRDEIASEIIALGYTRDRNFANRLAELTLQKSAAQAAENQFAADYDYRAWQFYEQEQQAARQLELEKAYNELNTFGKVLTKESAAALGVPLGTTTYAVQMQELARKSSGRTGPSTKPPAVDDTSVSQSGPTIESYKKVAEDVKLYSERGYSNLKLQEIVDRAYRENKITDAQRKGIISAYKNKY